MGILESTSIKWNGSVIVDGLGALLVIGFFIAAIWMIGYAAGYISAKRGD